MSAMDELDKDLFAVFRRWEDREAEYFERSRLAFEEAVRPAAYYERKPDPRFIVQANMAYTEWFLFEFGLAGGKTPLELFVERPPDGTRAERLGRLEQVAQTQRFSRFAIRDKRVETGELGVVDLRTGERLVVRNERACQMRTWRDGTLGQRIARVEGEWLLVGQTLLYDRASYEPLSERGPGDLEGMIAVAMGPEGPTFVPREPTGSYFLDVLRDVIGIDGPYRSTLRLRTMPGGRP